MAVTSYTKGTRGAFGLVNRWVKHAWGRFSVAGSWTKATRGGYKVVFQSWQKASRGKYAVVLAHTKATRGRYRVANAALSRHEFYIGQDAMPDFTAAPAKQGDLPLTSDPLAVSHTYYIVTRLRNEYNLLSQNINPSLLVINGDGTTGVVPPGDVEGLTVAAYTADGGLNVFMTVVAYYHFLKDGADAGDEIEIWWNIVTCGDAFAGVKLTTITITDQMLRELSNIIR